MAIVAWEKFRFLWGAVDWQQGTDHPYAPGETANLGTSAAPGAGIGVRRAVVTFDRTQDHAAADPVQIHFDFLNFTGGVPDDTWTSGDYTTLEGVLTTALTSLRQFFPSGVRVTMITWYRVGPGIVAPNPAERQTLLGSPIAGTGAATVNEPQSAISITFRTSVRRSWGRTYLPNFSRAMAAGGVIGTSDVDLVANTINTMVGSAASSDFALVVISNRLNAALQVEHVEVDNNPDVVRRRRWKSSTYKKILP